MIPDRHPHLTRRCLLLCLFALAAAASAQAGVLGREDLARLYPAPLVIGEKDGAMPIWPVFQPNFQRNARENELLGYLFESIDLAPVPGFSGVPVNLLIALDTHGGFLDVRVLSQHEPVFVDGLGTGPLQSFVAQYKGLSLKQNIKILTGAHGPNRVSPESAELDGVTKATASVRIINQSILSAALKVARKKLGYAEGRDPDLVARVKGDLFEPRTVAQLLDAGLLTRYRLSNAEIEAKFAGSAGAGLDPEVPAQPQAAYYDLLVGYVSVPSVGRNLLQESTWKALQSRLEPGDHALLVLSSGRANILGDDFVRGSTPQRIVLKQDQLPIEMRDLNLDLALNGGLQAPPESSAIFKVAAGAGLDPARPLDFALPVTRLKGAMFPERIVRDFGFHVTLPARFYRAAEADNKSWEGIWRARALEIALLALGLALLTAALLKPRWLLREPRRLAWFRGGYLLFTLVFVGWIAQGQLSIVTVTSVLQAVLAGRGIGFMLYDPMTMLLAAYVCVSLLVWGRGTFCGWLCPFGALQEFAAQAGRLVGLRPRRLHSATDRRLKWLKYIFLAAIVAAAIISPAATDKLVEIEPFKTAITLGFARAWPFAVYALALLVLNLWVFKFFCRYVCPLGAALALAGGARRWNWIARRAACGTPCQTCRHRCDYQAIEAGGAVRYDECFQCLECVAIHSDDRRCAPLLLDRKRGVNNLRGCYELR